MHASTKKVLHIISTGSRISQLDRIYGASADARRGRHRNIDPQLRYGWMRRGQRGMAKRRVMRTAVCPQVKTHFRIENVIFKIPFVSI